MDDLAIARVHSYSSAYPGVTAARNTYGLEHNYINSTLLGATTSARTNADEGTHASNAPTIIDEEALRGLNLYLSHNLVTNVVYQPILQAILAQEDTSAPSTSLERFKSSSAVVTYVCLKGNHVSRGFTDDITTKCLTIQKRLQSNAKVAASMERERRAESERIKAAGSTTGATSAGNADAEARAKGSHLGLLVYGVEPDAASNFPTLGSMLYLLESSK